jgi:hypothetical protein
MKTLRIPLLVISLLAMGALSSYAAQLASAKVTAVEGSVSKYSADGASAPLRVGDILVQGDSISVTALSSASLVFSNGSEITISENSSVNLAKLEQESFAGGQSYEQLQADPSTSKTLLELNYGELSGHVKSLKPGSSFDVDTPLGTAAIRGTKFSVRLFYNAERGEFLLIIRNKGGKVSVSSRYVGNLQYGSGNIADKGYDSGLSDEVTEPIIERHVVVIRLGREDPLFDDLFDATKNFIPTDPRPGFIPIPAPEITTDDKGVIVVSPEDQDLD